MVNERIRHDKEEINHLSKGEENINSDCQSIEEPKGWRFDWRKIIPLEPTAELIILVLLALLYGGFIITSTIRSMKAISTDFGNPKTTR